MGNQVVQRLFRDGVIQAKLTVDQPGDRFEQGADRMAELTGHGGGPILLSAATPSRSAVGSLQRLYGNQAVLQMRHGSDGLPAPSVPLRLSKSGILQRKCACGGAAGMSGECEGCSKKKRFGLQTKLTVNEPGDSYEQEADRIADQVMATPAHPAVSGAPRRIQRFAGQPTGQTAGAPASVDQALASPGRPLEPALRQNMEQRFGYDFSQVRVYTGSAAEQSARDVNAHAYTVGHNIVFGAGRFAPGTPQGRRLIAHELTHVVQQFSADGNSVDQSDEKHGPSRISQPVAERSVIAGSVQRAPAPPAEIEMPAEHVGATAGSGQTGSVPGSSDPTAFFNRMLSHPNYIDNNITKVNYFLAERAIIHYNDGSKLELGLVPKYMKPPFVEVDYSTPREDYRLRHTPEGVSFIRESDLQNVPESMPWVEVQKRYAQPVSFAAEGESGRIVPSRVNMLTAPNLCKVLLDSEKKFIKQKQWASEWGSEVAKVVVGMGTGSIGVGPRPIVGGGMAGRRGATEAAEGATGEGLRRRVFAQRNPPISNPALPPGTGSTNKFGDITISSAGSATDRALALYHEKVHSFLSPRLNFLRTFRANIGEAAYGKSSLLRYTEEALAETVAQLRVHGIRGLPTGIRFPIKEGYVTLSGVVTEAAIGTVVVGGTTYGVYIWTSQEPAAPATSQEPAHSTP